MLLNVLLMWAWPTATFFFSLRRTFLAPGAGLTSLRRHYFLPAFFLPAMVFFGPLRVRALVLVR